MAKLRSLREGARRLSVYNDGPWGFLYDASHAAELAALRAADVLIGGAADAAAAAAIRGRGLLLAWELFQDDPIEVELAVGGRGLTKKEKAGLKFLPPREGWLDLPSGRLRLESLNSLAIRDEETTDQGAEVDLEPGRYRVCVETLDRDDARLDDNEDVIPSDFIRLVRLAGDASPDLYPLLRLPGAADIAEADPTIAGDVLTTETIRGAASTTALLLRCGPAEAERLGLRLGDRLAIATGGSEIEAAYSGFLTPRAWERLLGVPRPLGGGGVIPAWIAGFAFLNGELPIVLEVERWAPHVSAEAPSTGSQASIRRLGHGGLPAVADDLIDKARMKGGRLHAHALFAAPGALLLNVAFKHLRKLGVTAMKPSEFPLMLGIAAQTRTVLLELRRSPDALQQALETFFPKLAEGQALRAELERLDADYGAKLRSLRETLLEYGPDAPAVSDRRAETRAARAELEAALPAAALSSLPLVASLFPSWRDPDEKLLLLEPLVGLRTGLEIAAGDAVELGREGG